MTKSVKAENSVKYISKNATKEQMIKFICADDRKELAALRMLGADFLDSQEETMLLKFLDNANAWEPEKLGDELIAYDFKISEEDRTSTAGFVKCELDSKNILFDEKTEWTKIHISLTSFQRKGFENNLAEMILQFWFDQHQIACTTKNGEKIPETAKLEKSPSDLEWSLILKTDE